MLSYPFYFFVIIVLYKLQLDLLVITMLSVFPKPTVIVPKSSKEGLISIEPSLPAPIIWIDFLMVYVPSSVPFWVILKPEPGLK